MTTMNISLPDDLKAFVEDEAAGKGFASASDYVRAILVDAQIDGSSENDWTTCFSKVSIPVRQLL